MDKSSKKSVAKVDAAPFEVPSVKLQPEDEAEKPVSAPVLVPPPSSGQEGKRKFEDEAEKQKKPMSAKMQKKDEGDSSSESGSVLIKHAIEGGPSSSSVLSSERQAFWSENIGALASFLFKHGSVYGPSNKKFRFKKGVDPNNLVDKFLDGEIPLEECPTSSDDSDDDSSSDDSDDDSSSDDSNDAAKKPIVELEYEQFIRCFLGPMGTIDLGSLTSLYLGAIGAKFPNSLNLPMLTYLGLKKTCFCGGNDGRVDPFSTFTSLTTLFLFKCETSRNETLYISSTSLLNLSLHCHGDYFHRHYLHCQTQQSDSHIELLAPTLCTCDIVWNPRLRISGSHLSSIKQVRLRVLMESYYSVETRLGLLNFLIGMTNMESLNVFPTTLQALSVIQDVLKRQHTSWRNLKSVKLNMSFESYVYRKRINNELVGGKSWKENAELRRLVELELDLVGNYSFTLESMIQFFLQNSPSAEIGLICSPTDDDWFWSTISIPEYAR